MGSDLVALVIREAMAARGLDRQGVVDRLGVSARKRSEWFLALDRLRAGQGASVRQLARFAEVLGIDPLLINAAVADDEGEELHRYREWEAWAWEPAVPVDIFEVIAKGYGRRHPLDPSITREQALAHARDLARRTGHWVSVPAFRSRAAQLSISSGSHDGERRYYLGGVPHDEVSRFRLRSCALRCDPPAPARV